MCGDEESVIREDIHVKKCTTIRRARVITSKLFVTKTDSIAKETVVILS